MRLFGCAALFLLVVSADAQRGGRRPIRQRGRDSSSTVTTSPDGLKKERLRPLVPCNRLDRAEAGDRVFVSYTGSLQSDGKVFDSTEGKDPISFELGSGLVIKGWERGIEGTCPGQRVRLTIPPELGYGSEGVGEGVIPGGATLIFDLTLVDVEKPGLDIETISGGECSEEDRVRRKDNVTLHYTARLAADDKVFDSSYDRDQPLNMIVGKAGIKGWDDGVYKACKGELRRVIVPYRLGYGEEGIPGIVPPKATIILEMEILDIGNRVDLFLQQISQGLFGR